MQHHVFIILFISGFPSLTPVVSREYYLIQQMKTWNDAQTYCRTNYIDLATIQTTEEKLQIQKHSQNLVSGAWIGLYNDINSWRFSLRNASLSVVNWLNSQPDNYNGIEACGMILNQLWNDGWCYIQLPFVCVDEIKIGSDRYIVYLTQKTWYDAQSYCRQYHTDLASIRDNNENLMVQNQISASVDTWVWFGLFRDTWKWSDQANVTNIDWMPETPNNMMGHEDCAYINYQVSDSKCSELMPFFCYSTTKRMQILKINIQEDKHSNSPAIKAAILEQIRQKLQEHGLSKDIMLKWKELPVFHPEKMQILRLKVQSQQNLNDPRIKAALLNLIKRKLQKHGLIKDIMVEWKELPVFHPEKKQIFRLKVQSQQNVNNPRIKSALLNLIQKKLQEMGLASNTMVKWTEPSNGVVFKKIKNNK